MKAILEAVLWLTALALALHAAVRLIGEHAMVQVENEWVPPGYNPPPQTVRMTADAARLLEERNPFALVLPNQADSDTVSQVGPISLSAPSQPSPPMVVAGVSRGPDWRALIEGVPGVAGALPAQVGDSIAGLLVQTIDWNGVTLVSTDTVMVLMINNQWR